MIGNELVGLGILYKSLTVNTEENWWFKISALSSLLLTVTPSVVKEETATQSFRRLFMYFQNFFETVQVLFSKINMGLIICICFRYFINYLVSHDVISL